jgi:hypothetical protein
MSNIDYENYDLLIYGAPGAYRARVISSPVGGISAAFTLPFTEDERRASLQFSGRGRHLILLSVEDPPLEPKGFGERLYRAVFAGEVGAALLRSLDIVGERGKGLRIRLRLDQEVPELAELPWEYLFCPELNRFLVLSDRTPIVRYLQVTERVEPLRVEPPLSILGVVSNPQGVPPLQVEKEWQHLQDGLSGLLSRGLVDLQRLETATLRALQTHLRRSTVHILHFIGHGYFDPTEDQGGLVFEDRAGQGQHVSAATLGILLYDHTPLRLVFLNACEGARGGRTDPFSGVAQHLVRQGVPAVLAMQFPVSDRGAIALANRFYGALAEYVPADTALSEARNAIVTEGSEYEWGTPVFFSRAEDNRLLVLPGGHRDR